MSCQWLIGRTGTVDEAAEQLRGLLGAEFEPHDSYYLGPYLLGSHSGIRDLRVRQNREEDDGELTEPDFPESTVLVDATTADRLAELDSLPEHGFTILRVREF